MALSHISTPGMRRLVAVGLAVIIALGAMVAITSSASAVTYYGCAPYCEHYSPPPEPAPSPEPPSDSTGFGDRVGDFVIGVAGGLVGAATAAQVSGDPIERIAAGIITGTAATLALDYAGVDERIAEPIDDAVQAIDDAITEVLDVIQTSCDAAGSYTGLGAPCGR